MKPFVQPEILRQKVEQLKDKHRDYITALPYLPLAISNLLSTMPLTELKYVKVMFYKTGILTVAKRVKRRGCGVLTRKSDDLIRMPLSEDDEPILLYDPGNFTNFCAQPVLTSAAHARTNLRIKKPLKTRVRCINTISPHHANTLRSLYGVKEYKNRKNTRSETYNEVLHSPFFYETEIDWLEAALQLLRQGHVILSSVLFAKDLTFLYVDGNFNLKKSRDITTKERKRGRIGLTFHLNRELLKFLKCIVDAHVAFRSGMAHQHMFINTVYDVLTNVGTYTAAYRHKYRIMRQIKKCKCIRRVDERQGTLSIDCMLRIWLSFFRGHIPLLYRYASNLARRVLNKREVHPKTITSQRIESAQEIHMRDAILAETNNKHVLEHLTEAWRSYKACLSYSTNNVELDRIIKLYIQEKMKRYERNTVMNRRRMYSGNIYKSQQRKNIGRIARLYLRKEITRQNEIMNMKMNVEESVRFYELMRDVLSGKYVPFPLSAMNDEELRFDAGNEVNRSQDMPFNKVREKSEIKKVCDVKGRKVKDTSVENKSTSEQRECSNDLRGKNGQNEAGSEQTTNERGQRAHELFADYKPLEDKIYEEMLRSMNVEDALPLSEIKNRILTQRVFKEVHFKLRDNISSAVPTYEVSEEERQIDSFVDLWISYFFNRTEDLFIRNIFRLKAFSFFCTIRIKTLPMDLNLLHHVLSIFIDTNIVQYLIARLNCTVVYKDINFVNRIGVLKGFEFSFLIYEAYYAAIDFLFEEQGVFYVRQDDRVIIARNDRMFDDQYLDNVLARRGCFTSIFAVCDRVFTANEFSFHNLHVSRMVAIESMCSFVHHIRNINAFQSFLNIIEKWNMYLLSLVVTYREFLTDEHKKVVLKWEDRILNLIKNHINSKMPTRFPDVIFYAPVELGGLGMFSIGNNVPSLTEYVRPWSEILDEHGEFVRRRRTERRRGMIARGGHAGEECAASDETVVRNVRIRGRYKRYSTGDNPFAHFSSTLDGKLWSTRRYKYDMTEFFGGPERIISQSVLASINTLYDPQTLWHTTTYGTMTRAQLSGTRLFPNRRFVFYWSPLINTSDVYVGYATVMDKSGIVMHGKLASLKMSYLKIFRDNLWMKICEGYVVELVRMNGCKKMVVDGKKWYGGMGADAVFANVSVYDGEYYDKKCCGEACGKGGEACGKGGEPVDDIKHGDAQGMAGEDRSSGRKHTNTMKHHERVNNGMSLTGEKGLGDEECSYTHQTARDREYAYGQDEKGYEYKNAGVNDRLSVQDPRKTINEMKSAQYEENVSVSSHGDENTVQVRSNIPCATRDMSSIVKADALWCDVQFTWGNHKTNDIGVYTQRRYLELKNDPLCFYPCEKGFVVGVDLLYNKVCAFGCLPVNLQLPQLAGLREYEVLRSRILKTLGLEVNEKVVGMKELSNSIIKYEEYMFNARTGVLTVEDSLNSKRGYDGHVIAKNASGSTQSCVVMDRSEGVKSKCKIFFPALRTLLTEEMKEQLRNNGINIYKHWKYSSYTNFCRFVLILNAYRISKNLVLSVRDIFGYKDDKELIVMEHFLKDVIINKYKEEHGIKRLLSNTEVKEIVFGMDVDVYKDLRIRTRDRIGDEIEKKVRSTNKEVKVDEKWKNWFKYSGTHTSRDRNTGKKKALNHSGEQRVNSALMSHGVMQSTEHGTKQIMRETFARYEMVLINRQKRFDANYSENGDDECDGPVNADLNRSQTFDLMANGLKCTALSEEAILSHTYQDMVFSSKHGQSLQIPKCLIDKLLEISSPQIPLLALVLKGNFTKIYSAKRYVARTAHPKDYFLALPPQYYNGKSLMLPSDPVIDINDITGMVLVSGTDEQMMNIHSHFKVPFAVGKASFLCADGYFLVPDKNYNFYFRSFDEHMRYEYVLGTPAHFYDLENRFGVNHDI